MKRIGITLGDAAGIGPEIVEAALSSIALPRDFEFVVIGDYPQCVLGKPTTETARAAAFEDSRFSPVTRAEAPELKVSLSVLSPLSPIRPEDVEVGRHGLVVSLGANRGLLLPQVPAEYGWDRETFLRQTCHKAGLPSDAWLRGALLESFTAEVFGDNRA